MPRPQSHPSFFRLVTFLILLPSFLVGCAFFADEGQSTSIPVTITDGSRIEKLSVTPGTTVQQAVNQAGFELSALDRSAPPLFTEIVKDTQVDIIRVTEEFITEETTIPFSQQQVRNESLPYGQQMLIQSGINGLQQTVYRQVTENGTVISSTLYKVVTIVEAKPEIIMIGVQAPFTPQDISGRIAYLTGGNAWVMETTTANRTPLVTSGDLDGRVFSLSPDGSWLLFTRTTSKSEQINDLWVVSTNGEGSPVSLDVSNIILFADWEPDRQRTITYSTVEPRTTAPGWQANNDLWRLSFSESGSPNSPDLLLEPNAGGLYGWWGTTFKWSPDGQALAYARPDSVGLVNLDAAQFQPIFEFLPYRTGSDWAWVPGIAWSPIGKTLYSVTHEAGNGASSDESNVFNLLAIVNNQNPIPLQPRRGMFAVPVAANDSIASLSAFFPDQSQSSRYKLSIMDIDGSNNHVIFPPEGSPGLDPQVVAFEPAGTNRLAFHYQGNLFIISAQTGEHQQITGDGLITNIDWK